MEINKLKKILEAVLLATDRTLSVIQLEGLFELDEERPTRDEVRQALHEMADDYADRGYELKQVASGFRLQVRQEYSIWIGRLWEERPARYTRALLETMALIAYRQPITRGEIEEVRGVSVSSNIIKTLLERNWIKVLGHKDIPGKPSLYGSTKEFLDYFNLQSLDQLPTLAEIKDLDSINPQLAFNEDNNIDETESSPDEVDTEADTAAEGIAAMNDADYIDYAGADADAEAEDELDEAVQTETATSEDELAAFEEALANDDDADDDSSTDPRSISNN